MAILKAKQTLPNKLIEQETFGQLLLSIRSSLIRRGERLLTSSGFDINYTQVRVLRALSECDSMSATDLARAVEHDGGALTRMLDRLQEKGYVARRPNAKDRRGIEVFMTDKGKAVWRSMQDCVKQVNADVLDVLNDEEQTQLFGLLNRIRNHIDESAGQ